MSNLFCNKGKRSEIKASHAAALMISVCLLIVCSDGAGRTGTYILIDMVLNRMAKGNDQWLLFRFLRLKCCPGNGKASRFFCRGSWGCIRGWLLWVLERQRRGRTKRKQGKGNEEKKKNSTHINNYLFKQLFDLHQQLQHEYRQRMHGNEMFHENLY